MNLSRKSTQRPTRAPQWLAVGRRRNSSGMASLSIGGVRNGFSTANNAHSTRSGKEAHSACFSFVFLTYTTLYKERYKGIKKKNDTKKARHEKPITDRVGPKKNGSARGQQAFPTYRDGAGIEWPRYTAFPNCEPKITEARWRVSRTKARWARP